VDSRGPVDVEAAYAAHAAELTAFAATLVGRDDAGDVVATTVARVLARGRWAEVDHPRAYLYRAVYREAISVHRQFARRAALRDRLAGRRRGPSGPGEPDLADPELAAAVRALPARQRAVIVLTYWQDLTPDEIADRLGVSPGAVKKHLARARAAIREALSP
jgi:RNA polymerase sigma factor (sigma-70 family)